MDMKKMPEKKKPVAPKKKKPAAGQFTSIDQLKEHRKDKYGS